MAYILVLMLGCILAPVQLDNGLGKCINQCKAERKVMVQFGWDANGNKECKCE